MPPARVANALAKSIAASISASFRGGLLPGPGSASAGDSPPLNGASEYLSNRPATVDVAFKKSALCFAERREISAATS